MRSVSDDAQPSLLKCYSYAVYAHPLSVTTLCLIKKEFSMDFTDGVIYDRMFFDSRVYGGNFNHLQ